MANDFILINDDLRTMQIPSSIVLLGVESDDDVNRIPFVMPKTYCGFDLSQFEVRINYMNSNGIGDIYIADDVSSDGDDPSLMQFTWLVGRNACAYKGSTKFIVCLKRFDNDANVIQEFNTTVYSLPVLEGLETVDAVEQQNADIIEHILKLIEESGGVDLSNYYTKAEVNALKLPNPNALTINGIEYDGSEAVEMTIEGDSQTTAVANGEIIHVTDAVAEQPVKALTAYNAGGDVLPSANIAVANKNLFRIDLIADQTVSKGVTFTKSADGGIQASGTSTGTYAATQCAIDAGAFVVGETYTISSGKKSGILYVQLILNYSDGTTDYLVSSNQPYTFTLSKPVSSVTGSVQITSSGVTVNEWIYPMIEVSDVASAFVMNEYASMTYDGTTMPVLPDSISNVWSNDAAVANLVMKYWNDPVMAKVNELEKQFYQDIQLDDQLNSASESGVQNKVITAALDTKITNPLNAMANKVLIKNPTGEEWSFLNEPNLSDELKLKTIKDYVTPEMFGAVGDGVNDDTNAIQTAIESGLPIVGVNGHTYKVTRTLALPQYTAIYNCHFVGDHSLSFFNITSHCYLFKCYFASFYKAVFNSGNTVASIVNSCVFSSCDFGIYHDCGQYASLNQNRIINSYFTSNGIGIYLNNQVNACVVSGCVFEYCNTCGLYIGLNENSYAPSVFVTLNYFEGNKECAIRIDTNYYVPIKLMIGIYDNYYSTKAVPTASTLGIDYVRGASLNKIEDRYGEFTLGSFNSTPSQTQQLLQRNEDHSYTLTASNGITSYPLSPTKFALHFRIIVLASIDSTVNINLSGQIIALTNGYNELYVKRFSYVLLSRSLVDDESVTILRADALA